MHIHRWLVMDMTPGIRCNRSRGHDHAPHFDSGIVDDLKLRHAGEDVRLWKRSVERRSLEFHEDRVEPRIRWCLFDTSPCRLPFDRAVGTPSSGIEKHGYAVGVLSWSRALLFRQ